jgi:3-oxoacyl-[acyl-carrier-protein] synthase II
LGDAAEAVALKTVFGADAIESGRVLTTSTKGATGHLLGAAGAIEAAYTVMALHTGDVPPTFGYDTVDPNLRIPIVGAGGVAARLRDDARAAMSNSFGFGGTNASLVFARAPPLDAAP